MEQRNESYLKSSRVLLMVIVGLLIFIAIILLGDAERVLAEMSKVDVPLFTSLLGLTFVNYVLRFIKWHYLLKVLKLNVSLKTSFMVFLSGLSMAVTPGKVGELIKAFLLNKTDGISISKGLMVVIVERLSDVVGLISLSLIGLSNFMAMWCSLSFIVIALIIVLILLIHKNLFLRVYNVLTKMPFLKKYDEYAGEVWFSGRQLLSPKPFFLSALLSSVSWFFECLALYLLINHLGFDVNLTTSTFVFSFSSILGSFLVLPGGLGAMEGSLFGLLIGLGTPLNIAAASTVVIRICTLWFGVVVGVISLLLLTKNMKREPPASTLFITKTYEFLDLVVGGVLARLMKLMALLRLRPNMNEVMANLWVGGLNSPELIISKGITIVLDLREAPDPKYGEALKIRGLKYLNIAVRDGHSPSPEVLSKIVKWLEDKIEKGERVFVHCDLGRGRAPLVVAAYLVSRGHKLEEAIKRVKRARLVSFLNDQQRRALKEYFAYAQGLTSQAQTSSISRHFLYALD